MEQSNSDILARDSHKTKEPASIETFDPTMPAKPFPPADPKQEELGQFGGFRLLRVLGQGGMGKVFEVEDILLRRRVALKVIRPDAALRSGMRERFFREARLAASLTHPHIVPVYQVGEENGVPFLAMPLLVGESLKARADRDGMLPVAESLRISREIAEGLAAAHEAGLVHRDIKPANVWLQDRRDAPPQTVILDFGLARPTDKSAGLTQLGALLGTPGYLSPEQADGRPLDGRSDLFSLGCVLYLLVTGKPAFPSAPLSAALRAVAECNPTPPRELNPTLSADLDRLLMELLARTPEARPASARVVVERLRTLEQPTAVPRLSANPSVPLPPLPSPSQPPPPRRKLKRLLAGVSLAALLLVLATWQLWPHTPENQDGPTPQPPALAAYKGWVDVVVWSKDGQDVRKLRLGDPGALPLQAGDQFRLDAEVQPAAYVYLFWIDTEGKVDPIYPWKPGQWGTRPATETPCERLELPPNLEQGYRISGERQGMITLLLLARPEPLTRDEELQSMFAGLGEQRPVQSRTSAVWFENGKEVKDDPRRQTRDWETSAIDDPVLRMQALLRERAVKHAPFTSAVSFAKQGR